MNKYLNLAIAEWEKTILGVTAVGVVLYVVYMVMRISTADQGFMGNAGAASEQVFYEEHTFAFLDQPASANVDSPFYAEFEFGRKPTSSTEMPPVEPSKDPTPKNPDSDHDDNGSSNKHTKVRPTPKKNNKNPRPSNKGSNKKNGNNTLPSESDGESKMTDKVENDNPKPTPEQKKNVYEIKYVGMVDLPSGRAALIQETRGEESSMRHVTKGGMLGVFEVKDFVQDRLILITPSGQETGIPFGKNKTFMLEDK